MDLQELADSVTDILPPWARFGIVRSPDSDSLEVGVIERNAPDYLCSPRCVATTVSDPKRVRAATKRLVARLADMIIIQDGVFGRHND
jgi:hypothetical protein